MTSKPTIKSLWNGFNYFSHQPEAIEWMMNKEQEGTTIRGVPIFGGILGDEMGLGKTIEMAGLIKNRPVLRTLILTPLAVIGAWTTVLERCGFAVFTFKKHGWVLQAGKRGTIECYLTNVDKLLHNPAICQSNWDRVILDEAHRIRNPGSKLFKACKSIEAGSRWALTATPIVNKMEDVVALFAFLRVPIRKPLKWKEHMYYWAKDLVLHRSIDQLRGSLPDAPPKHVVHDLVCQFETKAEEEFYLAIQGAADEAISKRYRRDRIDMTEVFKQLMRLRQISVHPQVFIEARRREAIRDSETYRRGDWDEASTKFIKLAEIMEKNEEKNQPQKYIIICHFHDEIGLLQDFLLEGGFMDKVYTYDGSMTAGAREETLKAATAEVDRCAIIVQLQTGGVGINLQTFNNVVFMSPWWTSAMMDQAIGRAVRMGQKRQVQVYRIFYTQEFERARNIDKLMNDKAEMKRELLELFWKKVDPTTTEETPVGESMNNDDSDSDDE
jgi:SNF2 family DNA or RNA helicase